MLTLRRAVKSWWKRIRDVYYRLSMPGGSWWIWVSRANIHRSRTTGDQWHCSRRHAECTCGCHNLQLGMCGPAVSCHWRQQRWSSCSRSHSLWRRSHGDERSSRLHPAKSNRVSRSYTYSIDAWVVTLPRRYTGECGTGAARRSTATTRNSN